jgi:hypothetical protein
MEVPNNQGGVDYADVHHGAPKPRQRGSACDRSDLDLDLLERLGLNLRKCAKPPRRRRMLMNDACSVALRARASS